MLNTLLTACHLTTFRRTITILVFRPCPGVKSLNLARVGWGIFVGTDKSLKRDTDVLSFNMDVFKGKEFTLAIREEGSEVRSMTKLRASQS